VKSVRPMVRVLDVIKPHKQLASLFQLSPSQQRLRTMLLKEHIFVTPSEVLPQDPELGVQFAIALNSLLMLVLPPNTTTIL